MFLLGYGGSCSGGRRYNAQRKEIENTLKLDDGLFFPKPCQANLKRAADERDAGLMVTPSSATARSVRGTSG
jgi:hypothetical protein